MEETQRLLPDDERQRIAGELAARDIESDTVFDDGKFRPAKKLFDLNIPTLSAIEEKEIEWFLPGYIPRNQITCMAGDGGSGKTSLWCDIVAAASSGKKSIFEHELPEEFAGGEPRKVLVFSAEDTAENTLKKKLRLSGANMDNIWFLDINDERLKEVKFNSSFLAQLIDKYRPDLAVFDPIQAFVDPKIRMGDRNAMRNELVGIANLGAEYKVTTLIIMHANKQSGVWGRKRMADSADIWDIARSVLMVGTTTENSIHYVSQEKSNYDLLNSTILFSLDGGAVRFKGTTLQKDRDFVLAESQSQNQKREAPEKDRAKAAILEFLESDNMRLKTTSELKEMAKAHGISNKTLRTAKEELKKEGKVKDYPGGGDKRGEWKLGLIASEKKGNMGE